PSRPCAARCPPGRAARCARGRRWRWRRRRRRRRPPTPRARRRDAAGSWLPQHVADAPHGVDQARLAACLRLPAQVPDVDVEGLRARAEVVLPDALEDELARENPARVLEKELEQAELRAGQL